MRILYYWEMPSFFLRVKGIHISWYLDGFLTEVYGPSMLYFFLQQHFLMLHVRSHMHLEQANRVFDAWVAWQITIEENHIKRMINWIPTSERIMQ